ncbi:LamG-like jellyroll fold domain-containing protein [Planotetraspora kaengkrachanensis]|uniref:LamG-like jellyroll fold domain-containing protein n=1 Tax=Planotetraspora kaengkrachanensis TaxID=575193 RepID=UPI001943E6E3|nr:LamG-like jellyroll fold domain-containing protein [Planotetraspora kaengkrachanensis]
MRILRPGTTGRNSGRERSRLWSASAAFALAASLLAIPLPAAAADVPLAPTNLMSHGKPCVTGDSRPSVLTATPVLAARQQHPTPGKQSLTTFFYWWPLGGTRNETDVLSQASGNPSNVSQAIPAGRLTDGSSYVWQARTFDGTAFGPWSVKCQFTVDLTPPPAPAGVTSSDYPTGGPHGGAGVPGVFEVTAPAEGGGDIAGYEYSFDSGTLGGTFVAARAHDHGATITVAPPHDGSNRLTVWSKDRAGRFSSPFTYSFSVRAPAGPAAEWTFDEAGDAGDRTGHGNTVVLSGGATHTDGRGGVGAALSLDGVSAFAATNGPVRAPNPDTGTMTKVRTDHTFTVTARVKPSAIGGGEVAAVSVDGAVTSAYVLGQSGDRWTFRMAGSDTDAPVSAVVSSDAAATAGKWTHLAGVYDSFTHELRLYVNGVRQSTTATLEGGFRATGPTAIGRAKAAGVATGFLGGAVDDVRVYDYAESDPHLAAFAVPLQPVISFPDGDTVSKGGKLTVRFDARGDENVVRFDYSGGGSNQSVEAIGGSATVTIDARSTGTSVVSAVAVDAAGHRSLEVLASFTVVGVASVSGTVLDLDTFMPVEGATVTMEPGGLSMVTGPDGMYRFDGFPAGSYTLSASKGGACPLSSGSIHVDIPDDAVRRDLPVFPPFDDSGEPTCTPEQGSE